MTTRKVFAVVVLALVVFSVSAAFAANTVSSLQGLANYGTWVAIDGVSNGMKTADGTVTTAEFTLAEGFTAQWWVSDSSNGSIAKTGGNRTIPVGSAASVYDETAATDNGSEEGTPAEIKEYAADQLVTSADLSKVFTFVEEGTYGEVKFTVPANVKFTVHQAWTNVSVQDGSQILAGQSYTTGNSAETTTWWPNQEYLDKANTVELTSENFATYFTMGEASDSKWIIATPTAEANGKKFTLSDSSKVALVRNGSEVTDPDSINPEDGEVIIASKDVISNKDGSLFASVANVTAAAPVTPTVKRQDDGKYEVVFYCGSDQLYLIGTNLFKFSYDKNTVEEVETASAAADGTFGSKMLKSKASRAIGTITVYLSSQGSSNNGGSESGSGSGGGGCNATGASFLGLFLIPLFLRKRS